MHISTLFGGINTIVSISYYLSFICNSNFHPFLHITRCGSGARPGANLFASESLPVLALGFFWFERILMGLRSIDISCRVVIRDYSQVRHAYIAVFENGWKVKNLRTNPAHLRTLFHCGSFLLEARLILLICDENQITRLETCVAPEYLNYLRGKIYTLMRSEHFSIWLATTCIVTHSGCTFRIASGLIAAQVVHWLRRIPTQVIAKIFVHKIFLRICIPFSLCV